MELLDDEEGILLGYPCIVVSELVEVYEGFRDREDKERVVASGRVCVVWRGLGVGVSNLGYLSQ